MPTLLLLRHGRSTANTAALLAGRTPGVTLDSTGEEQAAAIPARLAGVPLSRIVHSPLERCQQTVAPLVADRPETPVHTDDRVTECDYGEWTGRDLAGLSEEPLMATVQLHPAAAVFPGGEAISEMQHRAVRAIREWDELVAREHGADATWLLCSHGDIIKAVVADALGMHLDLFQRISVAPGSVTVLRYTPERPFLLVLGDTGSLSQQLAPSGHGSVGARQPDSTATVGGSTG